MLTIALKGGLGNQLFQLAAAETIANQTNKRLVLQSLYTPRTHHSNENYFETILKAWKMFSFSEVTTFSVLFEKDQYRIENWKERVNGIQNVCLDGYFQHYQYIPSNFSSKLTFDSSILSKYDKYRTSAFLHIRGGDYVNHWFHDLKLDSYYKKAIERFPEGTHFYVFTNDLNYAETKEFLKDIVHTFVNDTEVNSLYLMSRCCLGGICANSSFSWWGAYLNRNRTLILPSKWFNDPNYYINGYYFEGCTVLDV
jgi:hypothetical protein